MFHFPPIAFEYRHWEFSGLVTVSPSECKAMLSDIHHSLFEAHIY
jgi:creatinine amidohydrolase/Fe(II)-dependent formamide hydrolase-like protein